MVVEVNPVSPPVTSAKSINIDVELAPLPTPEWNNIPTATPLVEVSVQLTRVLPIFSVIDEYTDPPASNSLA